MKRSNTCSIQQLHLHHFVYVQYLHIINCPISSHIIRGLPFADKLVPGSQHTAGYHDIRKSLVWESVIIIEGLQFDFYSWQPVFVSDHVLPMHMVFMKVFMGWSDNGLTVKCVKCHVLVVTLCRLLPWQLSRLWCLPSPQDDADISIHPKEIQHSVWQGEWPLNILLVTMTIVKFFPCCFQAEETLSGSWLECARSLLDVSHEACTKVDEWMGWQSVTHHSALPTLSSADSHVYSPLKKASLSSWSENLNTIATIWRGEQAHHRAVITYIYLGHHIHFNHFFPKRGRKPIALFLYSA